MSSAPSAYLALSKGHGTNAQDAATPKPYKAKHQPGGTHSERPQVNLVHNITPALAYSKMVLLGVVAAHVSEEAPPIARQIKTIPEPDAACKKVPAQGLHGDSLGPTTADVCGTPTMMGVIGWVAKTGNGASV